MPRILFARAVKSVSALHGLTSQMMRDLAIGAYFFDLDFASSYFFLIAAAAALSASASSANGSISSSSTTAGLAVSLPPFLPPFLPSLACFPPPFLPPAACGGAAAVQLARTSSENRPTS